MIFHCGNIAIPCDRCTETNGRYTMYQFDVPIKTIANVPPQLEITAEGGEIEHVPTPLEAAENEINDLQADLASVWADMNRIHDLIKALGEAPTLSGLLKFLADLKAIIAEDV